MLWRDGGFYIVSLASKSMIGFAVVAGVGKNVLNSVSVDRRCHYFLELIDINTWASCGDRREYHVIAAITGNR